jgi:hypothetical protein
LVQLELPRGKFFLFVVVLQGAFDNFQLPGLFALESMGYVDADCIILLESERNALVDKGIAFVEVDEVLADLFVGFGQVHKDGIFDVHEDALVLHVFDHPLEEVLEIGLEDDQSSVFVVSVSADCQSNKDSVEGGIHKPE